MALPGSVRTKRWTRVEYERLVDLGAFRPGERVELVAGVLLVGEPQNSQHATAVGLTEDTLREAFGDGWTVRVHGPIALDDDSEPEPDITVLPGAPRNYRASHPTAPPVVVEVALASLALDRGEKASLYARAGVADYWIVNLVDNVLEVYRAPVANPHVAHGWRYASTGNAAPGRHGDAPGAARLRHSGLGPSALSADTCPP